MPLKQNKPEAIFLMIIKELSKYNPQRAVFAIPNNFTATKIMDLRKSIEKLNLFKEVRFIYEAEAVLIYYLFSKRKKPDGQEVELIDGEKILIYDMGGATVNVTLAQINKKGSSDNLYYEVDILAKLGYGIGGDAIDLFMS
jgi:molecular chaperone DnaK (HSP70)